VQARRDLTFDEIKANNDKNDIRCADLLAGERMMAEILKVKDEGDTCGGIVEVIARGVPAGLGEPVFDKVDATLAHAMMSIGAVKGVEVGSGFAATRMKGSEHNDIPYIEDGKVRFSSNNAGGILGGITNGDDLVVRIAVKPTSTISKDQPTINMRQMREATLAAITRRDATITARIVAVAEAMMAIVIVDHLLMWKGYECLNRRTRE
jgi:chorismate synthase